MAFALTTASGGAILLGVLIALSTYFEWPRKLDYLWALIAIVWGVLGAMGTI
jgi:hypothetical protein